MKQIKFAVVLAAVSAAVGCSTTPSVPDVGVTPVIPGRAAAVVCGLTKVDAASAFYGGWDGDCPGCDVDAARVAAYCRGAGFATVVLENEKATCYRFVAQCAAAAASLKPAADAGASPLLFIYVSGHGGQVPDADGDEADGLDETVCLWDAQLLDDVMWAGLCKICDISPKIRVVFMTDACNSGTNYKAPSFVRAVAARRSRAASAFCNEFLHIGGCADGLSSYGGADGGVMTTAAFATCPPNGLTWRGWFDAFAGKMPRNQAPVFEYLPGDGCCAEGASPMPETEAMK